MNTRKPSLSVGNSDTLHLAWPTALGKPICGEPSPDAVIGTYTEHLDSGQWIHEVFDRSGRPGEPCDTCLSLYPAVLL